MGSLSSGRSSSAIILIKKSFLWKCMEHYKKVHRKVYDKNAEQYWEATKDDLVGYSLKKIEMFVGLLPGSRVLDLGSGPGRDSLYFKEKGLSPVCVDISPEMVRLCGEKGLKAFEMDLEDLLFDDKSFDGVWACASLLHMPKNRMPVVLDKVRDILVDDGIFYVGVKEGEGEGWIESITLNGVKRFYALYSDSEMRDLLDEDFEIVHNSRIKGRNDVYINYLCRKKLT